MRQQGAPMRGLPGGIMLRRLEKCSGSTVPKVSKARPVATQYKSKVKQIVGGQHFALEDPEEAAKTSDKIELPRKWTLVMPNATDAYRRLYYSNTEALHKTVVTVLQNNK